MRLTKTAIDRASYQENGPSRQVLWDDALPGFGVRVYPSGRKAFVLLYRAGRRQRFMVVGQYGVLTLQQAREQARTTLASVLQGSDPLHERQEATERATTFRELASAYLERHAKPRKRSWREDERRIENHLLPVWGNRPTESLTRADVAKLHHTIGSTRPYEANRTLALISVMFAKGLTWGVLPEGQANPAHGIEKFREASRDRWVSPEELPRLARAIEAQKNIYIRAALWLYLLTGARKTELLSARWEDVDLTRGELRLPQTKGGRIHYIPLSAPARALLSALPRAEENPYVLPSVKRTGRHLVNISKPWNEVRKAAGCPDVRLHDLRRTVGSWLATSGYSLHLIGTVLGHRDTATTKVYARLAEDQSRKALEEHGAKLLEVVGHPLTAETERVAGATPNTKPRE